MIVDGLTACKLSDFADTSKSVKSPLIISHNGASGDFPGCTLPAYAAAINYGADYIDCTVQITSDGVAICRENADLLLSTNIFANQILYQQYAQIYPDLQPNRGVFAFDVPWADVSTLKGKSFRGKFCNFLHESYCTVSGYSYLKVKRVSLKLMITTR